MATDPSPFVGVLLHAIGGFAAASFYVPYKRVQGWPWENAWILGGVFSWLIAPAIAAAVLAPASWGVITEAPTSAVVWTFAFGFLWGIGGLCFGLTMRYLGLALGYAVALGMCAFFGTLAPPVFSGEMGAILGTTSGQVVLGGIILCLVGIAMSGKAGLCKEQEVSDELKRTSVAEFNYAKGMLVAVFAGAMSACMAFGFAAGKPIAKAATDANIAPLWQNLPVLIVVLGGGFALNFLWCVGLIVKRRSAGAYTGKIDETGASYLSGKRLAANYLWCAAAGVTWYLQFFFTAWAKQKWASLHSPVGPYTWRLSSSSPPSGAWLFASGVERARGLNGGSRQA